MVVEGDEVGSVGEVGLEPPECSTFDTDVLESGEQDVVAHGVEGCTHVEVEEDEDVKGTGVSRGEEVIEDFGECRFCAVVGTKTRLKGFKKVICLKMAVELFGDDKFYCF